MPLRACPVRFHSEVLGLSERTGEANEIEAQSLPWSCSGRRQGPHSFQPSSELPVCPSARIRVLPWVSIASLSGGFVGLEKGKVKLSIWGLKLSFELVRR